MATKLDSQDSIEVEFQCDHSTKRVPGSAVNEYIVTVQSPGGFQILVRNFLFLVPLQFFSFNLICMLFLANTYREHISAYVLKSSFMELHPELGDQIRSYKFSCITGISKDHVKYF